MNSPVRIPYTALVDPSGAPLMRPILPVSLASGGQSVRADALLDSGADANVLPYSPGLELGLRWDRARPVPAVSGNLGQAEARAVAPIATVQPFDPVMMVFVWVKSDEARLLLGQINFFQEFDVCFFGAAGYFEVSPKDQHRR